MEEFGLNQKWGKRAKKRRTNILIQVGVRKAIFLVREKGGEAKAGMPGGHKEIWRRFQQYHAGWELIPYREGFLRLAADLRPDQEMSPICRTTIISNKRVVKYNRNLFVSTDAFLETYEWRKIRMLALKRDGARCQCCGATAKDGIRIHVDHIKPRKDYPELALELSNLQVLCGPCNHGKGNWDSTDWR